VNSGRRQPFEGVIVGDRIELRYSRTTEPGLYRIRYKLDGKERTVYYVVHPPAIESNLTPLKDDQWRSLIRRVGFEMVEPDRQLVATYASRDRQARELWPLLLGGVLVLGVVELLITRRSPEAA